MEGDFVPGRTKPIQLVTEEFGEWRERKVERLIAFDADIQAAGLDLDAVLFGSAERVVATGPGSTGEMNLESGGVVFRSLRCDAGFDSTNTLIEDVSE